MKYLQNVMYAQYYRMVVQFGDRVVEIAAVFHSILHPLPAVFSLSPSANDGLQMPSFYSVVRQYIPIVRQVYNPYTPICEQRVTEMVCEHWEEMLEEGDADDVKEVQKRLVMALNDALSHIGIKTTRPAMVAFVIGAALFPKRYVIGRLMEFLRLEEERPILAKAPDEEGAAWNVSHSRCCRRACLWRD